MRLHFFPNLFFIGLVILLVLINLPWKRRPDPARKFFLGIFGVYLLFLAGVTFFPLPLTSVLGGAYPSQSAAVILDRINFVPVGLSGPITLHSDWRTFDLVGNVLLTIPFGLMLPLVAHIQPPRYIAAGLGVGLGIEMGQLLMSMILGAAYRAVDINDVIMNMLGVLAGYLIFRVFGEVFATMILVLKVEPKGVFSYVFARAMDSGRRRISRNE